MRTVRAVLLAIVATLALAGGLVSTAEAGTGPHKATPNGVGGPRGAYDQIDPADPPVQPSP